MKTLCIIFVVLFVSSQFKFEDAIASGSVEPGARIPGFIGIGYHALKGNPHTHRVDQGFRAPIFAMTYEKKQTTDDGLFLIPDGTYSTQTISCSMQSKVKQYSGTRSYQAELQNMASFDTRISMVFMDAKFSFSSDFATFTSLTVSKKQTAVQSNAECIVYKVLMPIYSNQFQLSQDFIDGVKYAYSSGNWEEFLNHFGSHYATSVTFGGRYFLEHTYSEESMSLFKSLKIDIAMSAKIQFFQKNGMEMSEQYKNYVNQSKVVNTKVEVERLATIGGLPPKSGNWVDWAESVKANLAPISYELSAISILFNYIPGIDTAGVLRSFHDYLSSYCGKAKCPPMIPDRPDPQPLNINFLKTNELKGPSKGKPYDTNDGQVQVGMRVVKIMMGFQNYLDAVQLVLSNGLISHASPKIGTIATHKQYQIPAGEQISCIKFGLKTIQINGTSWLRLASVQYQTKQGSQSQEFRGSVAAASYQYICISNANEHFIGFFGYFSTSFDSIGLTLMKESLPEL